MLQNVAFMSLQNYNAILGAICSHLLLCMLPESSRKWSPCNILFVIGMKAHLCPEKNLMSNELIGFTRLK